MYNSCSLLPNCLYLGAIFYSYGNGLILDKHQGMVYNGNNMERVLMFYLEYLDDKGWKQRYEHLTINEVEAVKVDLVEKGINPNTMTISNMK
jgi:hypothetical protein